MTPKLYPSMCVRVNVPDKPELSGTGFILAELLAGDGRKLFQADMGDRDNWFPAEWLTAIA